MRNTDPAPNTCISIPQDLKGCHPLITQTRRSLESARPGENQIRKSSAGLDVRVSKGSIHRGLLFLEAFVRSIEAAGHAFRRSSSVSSHYQLVVEGQEIEFAFLERVVRMERHPDQDGRRAYPRYDFNPTGDRVFRIEEFFPMKIRKTWADGKTQTVEDKLNEIVGSTIAFAKPLRAHMEERERRHREWKEQSRQAELQRRRQEEEKRRRKELCDKATLWSRSREIHQFLDAIEKNWICNIGVFPEECHERRWMSWARSVATQLDPINNGFPQLDNFAENTDSRDRFSHGRQQDSTDE